MSTHFNHHPDPEIDFEIECGDLEGEAYDVKVGLVSQWPFWARLSRALRFGRENNWFGRPNIEEFLRGLERGLTRRSG
jgi:hypothetical protein